MSTNNDHRKFPRLRDDLVISNMVNKNTNHWVIKDPLKNSYFRFSDEEYQIIKYFNGDNTLEQIVERFNQDSPDIEIDLELVEDYWNNLNDLNVLVKSQEEMNVMLVEKIKEMRQFQLLSKKGSIMYKRFPIVDPDKFFNRIIPKISFFWSRGFFIFSASCMLLATMIILMNWAKFNQGIYELFNFGSMSVSHMFVLWVVIYTTIAIHELGHGLTCKYYGGEVHEIGFLLLFFQPCLYANVNDAWLFDKKWKQILVTLAGGYIEFFIGAIFTFIWVLTNPNTFINVISFQVMTICSISTVMFNFNPLIKLDGYYLLSDFVEIPNLKEDSLTYLKYLASKYIFRMPEDRFEATKREKKIYFLYGVCSFTWMALLLTGLVGMAKGLLVDQFHEYGMLITAFIAYKIFGSYVTKSGKFLMKWFLHHREQLKQKKIKFGAAFTLVVLIATLFVPVSYKIRGNCSLGPGRSFIIRSLVDGEIEDFQKLDGEGLQESDLLFTMRNINLENERRIASLSTFKQEIKVRKALTNNKQNYYQEAKELQAKRLEQEKKEKLAESLNVHFSPLNFPSLFDKATDHVAQTILSCEEQEKLVGKFVKSGEDICKLYDIGQVKTLIEVTERDVIYLNEGQEVDFKLKSDPHKTYHGKISKINQTGQSDPNNPKNKIYTAQIILENDGVLRPGMNGVAKIYGEKVFVLKYILVKLSNALRLDLFF